MDNGRALWTGLLAMLVAFGGKAQTLAQCHEFRYQAEAAIMNADTVRARQCYSALLNCSVATVHDIRAAFELALLQKDSAATTDLFQRCVIRGWTIQELTRQVPGLGPPFNLSWLSSMVDHYPELLRASYAVLDTALMNELDAMAMEDQKVRSDPSCQNPDDTRNDFCPAIQAVDSIHDQLLRDLILRNALPAPHRLGLSEGSFHLLLLHLTYTRASEGAWEFYEPVLLKGVREGTFPPGTYAMLCDAHQELALGQPSLYGMIIRYDEKAAEPRIQPIMDAEQVDERRAAIFLPPLKHWALSMGALMPDGYR